MRTLFTLVFIGVAAGAVYLWLASHQHEGQSLPSIEAPSAVPSESPAVHYPMPIETDQFQSTGKEGKLQPLPGLDQSDLTITDSLRELFGKERVDSLFNLQNTVRRIVVTVDNAAKHKQVSEEFLPLVPLETEFHATGEGDNQAISPTNFQRYAPFAELARVLNVSKLVSAYRHFYPLFQSAYRDLGTKGYFNDRLIEVIDNLLATPEVTGPIKLLRLTPHSKYKFANDQLEGLSSGQKVLIRMGAENAQVIKSKLRELRERLVKPVE